MFTWSLGNTDVCKTTQGETAQSYTPNPTQKTHCSDL